MSLYQLMHIIVLACYNSPDQARCINSLNRCAEPHYTTLINRYSKDVRKCFTIDDKFQEELKNRKLKRKQ